VRILLLLILSTAVFARETGYPVISVIRQEVHGAGSQTFDVVSDARGRLLFANLEGVLIHDGAWWTRVAVPTESTFKLAALDDGSVAVSLLDEIGLLRPNASGALEYVSLVPKLPPNMRGGLGQSAICKAPGGALFVTDFGALMWNGSEMRTVLRFPGEDPRRRCFADANALFIGSASGLYTLDGKKTFDGKRIDEVVGDFVIVRNEGLFHRDERPYETNGSQWLRGKSVMAALRIRDGRIAVATLRDGLLLMTSDGAIDQIIDAASGLPEEYLYGVAEDREGALWLALDTSIARIDVSMQVSVLDRRVGLRGALHTVTRHDGALIAGTADGVFVIEQTPNGPHARQIEGIRYPWSLLSTNGDLLAGTFGGVWISRGSAPPVLVEGTDNFLVYSMLASKRDPSLIWLGMDEGLAKLRRTGDGYRFEGIVPNAVRFIRSLVEKDGVLWVASETEGVTRVGVDGAVTKIASGNVQVLEVADRVVFLPAGGVFSKVVEDHFVRDDLLGHIHAPEPFGYGAVDAAGNVWLGYRPPRLLRLAGGRYANEAHTIGTLEGDLETVHADADGVMWIGSERGLYRIAPSSFDASIAMPRPSIRRVVAGNDRVVADGNAAPIRAATLPHNFGRLRIEIAPLSYRTATSYQYRLDPIDTEWTPWSAQAFLDFTNLAADDYTFRVRTRGVAGRVSEESAWSFTILPPWYATWWAIAMWIALAAMLVAAIVRLRTRTLRRRATRLQLLVDGQTETLRETVEQLRVAKEGLEKLSLADPLTGVANRRYFDRVLADATAGAPISLILIDLDHFKELNDAQGHLAGDECLRRVAEYLESVMRGSGAAVCRWGGEEFAILLRNIDGAAALEIAERLRAGITPYGVTASLGVATDSDPRVLVERADRALYAAKRAGRNRVWNGSTEGEFPNCVHQVQ